MPGEKTRDRPLNTSPPVSDRVETTTCYMCACRCGIRVHFKNGGLRYIEGNPDHPVNRGVLCAKGSAGIMHQHSPAKLTSPLRRVGPRGSGEFEPISWDEALDLATEWLGAIRASEPRKLAFFTGRDQSQSLTGWWATQFGTPNYAAHGGFCSVNMAAAGFYTIGGSFWEFGEPDWERCRYFMLFGVAEDHASNPIKAGLAQIKARGAKFVSVNPIRTGYSAIADEWLGITPGTDGLFVMALLHELLNAGKVDVDYLVRYTNAGHLVIRDPGAEDDGLFVRARDGQPLAWDRKRQRLAPALEPDTRPALKGECRLPDGRRAAPVFQLLAERCLAPAYAPESVSERTGLSAARIRRIAAELARAAFEEEVVIEQAWTDAWGRRHDRMIGRPVAMHAMRGISAHSNGFHTARALHLLQILLGSIDCPGGFRYAPPFPQPVPPPLRPAGRPGESAPRTPLPRPPLGFPSGPADLAVDAAGEPLRIDKAFSWQAPLAIHGMMHTVITNAWKGDPYPIDTLFLYMTNMAWNSSMNTAETLAMLTDKDTLSGEYRIPHIIYSDAFFSETVPYADLVLPDTTYLERWDCISLLDRPISSPDGPADAIRQPVIEPDRDVRAFQDVLIDLGARLGLPGFVEADGAARYPGGYADYIVNHERRPGIGPLAGWRGENGAPNPDQLDRYIANGCYWREPIAEEALFFKNVNRAYLDHAAAKGWIENSEPIPLDLYSETLQRFRLAAQGHGPHQPPESERRRIETYFDPLPFWHPPFEDADDTAVDFPLHAISQRPMAMYHSWGSQNAWLRQIHTSNALYLPRALAAPHGIADGDWIWIESRHARVKARVRLMEGVNPRTVWTWNAIGKRAGAWSLAPEAPEAREGFLLNHLIDDLSPERSGKVRYANADPVTGQAAWYDLRVRLRPCRPEEAGATWPQFEELAPPRTLIPPPAQWRYGETPKSRR